MLEKEIIKYNIINNTINIIINDIIISKIIINNIIISKY